MQTKTNPSVDNTGIQASVQAADYDQVLNLAVSVLLANSSIEQNSIEQLQHARSYLFSAIDSSLSSSAGQSNSKMWSGWGWQPIINKSDLRIGLLEIHREHSIPIHDHPGGCGTLIVLKGKLAVTTYQTRFDREMEKSGLVVLSKLGSQSFEEKEYAIITETEGNIHSLTSISDVSVVLDILLKPYDESRRTWYIPVSEQVSDENSFICFSVNNRHFC